VIFDTHYETITCDEPPFTVAAAWPFTPQCVACHSQLCPLSQIGGAKRDVLTLGRATVCLAIPGKILEIQESGQMRAARVQFGGIVRQVSLDFVPEAGLGDYVMVHVGFAISRVDSAEAERTFKLLQEMGALEAEL
jgi:hydrogenase expression/formation protein HypC